MKKEYVILALMLLLILVGLWYFFFRGSKQQIKSLDTTTSQQYNSNNLSSNNYNNYSDNSSRNSTDSAPDGLKNYQEILIKNNNIIPFYIGESIPNLESGYAVSSAEEEVGVPKRIIKVLRPFDIVKLTKKEVKTGDAIMMAVVLKDANEVTINARSSAIAMVALELSDTKRKESYTIDKIASNSRINELTEAISKNLIKNYNISPMDFNTYPELSTMVDLIKKDIISN